MNSKECLKHICDECQKNAGKIQVACPFRSISNEYCDEYETIKKDLDRLEKLEKALSLPNFENMFVNLQLTPLPELNISLITNFENMFSNCELVPLPELEEEEYELLKRGLEK